MQVIEFVFLFLFVTLMWVFWQFWEAITAIVRRVCWLACYFLVSGIATYGILELLAFAIAGIRGGYRWNVFTITAYQYTFCLVSLRGVFNLGDWFSQFRKGKVQKPFVESEVIRSLFQKTPFTTMEAQSNHTHGIAAADRSAASSFADIFGALLGGGSYFVQKSRADVRNGRQGSREIYWVKDLNVEPEKLYDIFGRTRIPQRALAVLIDVDQYIDMEEFLFKNNRPVLIYTFQPEAVAAVRPEYSYTFENDEVEYRVTGGAVYKHKVWNWSVDNLFVSRRNFYGKLENKSYLVDRKRTSPDHELILLTPMGNWSGERLTSMGPKISGGKLIRLKISEGNGYNSMRIHRKDGLFASVGKEGGYLAATLPIRKYEAIVNVGLTSKYDLNLHTIGSYIDDPENRELSSVLLGYYESTHPAKKPPFICPVDDAVRRYQFVTDKCRYDPDAKASLKAYMSPLVHGAFAPDRCLSNEERAVEGRVKAVKPELLVRTTEISRYMAEFVERLIPEEHKHRLSPKEYDDVLDKQDRPTQRALLYRAEGSLPKMETKTFMKAEAYNNVKDPRIISTLSTPTKRDYSKVMYAFDEVLKRQPWYAFGLSPVAVARRVARIALNAKMVVNTDFSRFDGHVSNLLRELEEMVLKRAFKPEHHALVSELHKNQHHLLGRGTFGTEYLTEFSRLSGSPETSAFNSVDNAFIAYVALRKTMINGAHLEADEAYLGLGIYGGDDGLTADVDVQSYVAAARLVGQELTVEPVYRGDLGVKFLARCYSTDVWYGDENSCCDIARQLSKFHTTVNLPEGVTPKMKLLEKVRSFLLTDEHTPIIGALCRQVLYLNGGRIDEDKATRAIRSWLSSYDKSVQYKNQEDSWMWVVAQRSLPGFDAKRFGNWIRQCTSLDHVLNAPMFIEPPRVEAKSQTPVVEGGELHPLPRPTPTPIVPASVPIQQTGPGLGALESELNRPLLAELPHVSTWNDVSDELKRLPDPRPTVAQIAARDVKREAKQEIVEVEAKEVKSVATDAKDDISPSFDRVYNVLPGRSEGESTRTSQPASEDAKRVATHTNPLDSAPNRPTQCDASVPRTDVASGAKVGEQATCAKQGGTRVKETFEQMKERKLRNGTWSEEPPLATATPGRGKPLPGAKPHGVAPVNGSIGASDRSAVTRDRDFHPNSRKRGGTYPGGSRTSPRGGMYRAKRV